jgi:hypothetical protein
VRAELIERVKQCEVMTREALAANGELTDIAERYREEAKRVFVQIEQFLGNFGGAQDLHRAERKDRRPADR